ncbi:hypothetical protein GCM10023334_042980 [Nonomuraea thailandensis]
MPGLVLAGAAEAEAEVAVRGVRERVRRAIARGRVSRWPRRGRAPYRP